MVRVLVMLRWRSESGLTTTRGNAWQYCIIRRCSWSCRQRQCQQAADTVVAYQRFKKGPELSVIKRFRLQDTWRSPNSLGSSLVLPKNRMHIVIHTNCTNIIAPEIPLGSHHSGVLINHYRQFIA
uniref:Uncharacterized protein n=1 Tax=Oryza punctata TaxID=4537 RepID=A0A0E0M3U8_ORYPU